MDKQIKEIAKNIISLYSEFQKIKGIPLIKLISVLSEIVDIRNFKNTRAILAFLGLSLKIINKLVYASEIGYLLIQTSIGKKDIIVTLMITELWLKSV